MGTTVQIQLRPESMLAAHCSMPSKLLVDHAGAPQSHPIVWFVWSNEAGQWTWASTPHSHNCVLSSRTWDWCWDQDPTPPWPHSARTGSSSSSLVITVMEFNGISFLRIRYCMSSQRWCDATLTSGVHWYLLLQSLIIYPFIFCIRRII